MQRFNDHSQLNGLHAFLSPSTYHWINYSDEKLEARWRTQNAARHGTALHDFAKRAIELEQRLPDLPLTLNMFVNDALDFGLTPEQTLFYSRHCFGQADAIGFAETILRVSDLKTGTTPAGITQLEVYAALFCLEYIANPHEIQIELRIYQNDEVRLITPYPETIALIMERIIYFSAKLDEMEGSV